MKKVYTLSLALLIAGTIVAQKAIVKTNRIIEEGTVTISNVEANTSSSASLQLKSPMAILNETFEVGVPPSGWGGTDWLSSSTSAINETKATGHTGHFAYFDSYNLNVGVVGNLITPVLQPVAGTNTLSYSVNLYNRSTNTAFKGAGAKMYIEFSTDNGTTWTSSTTNVLLALPNYNTATNSGWITNTVSLAAYDGMNVMVRFRAVSDYGWSNIGIDNVTGPPVFAWTNDIAAGPEVFIQMNNFDYFEVIPNSQLTTASFGVVANNIGTAVQTNVTLRANTNSGSFTGATGINNPTPSLAAGAFDTLWTTVSPTASVPTLFETRLILTQNETDQAPDNNMADSITFYGSNYSFYRTVNIGSYVTPYSFGTSAPAITGMEYGATYVMPNLGRVDSITTLIYQNAGTGNVVGKLYTIDISGNYTLVASTDPYTPPLGTQNPPVGSPFLFTTLALTTPFAVPAGTVLAATIQLNVTLPADTIALGSNNTFWGDPGVAGTCYINVGGAMGWYSFGGVPIVGLELQNTSIGIDKNNTPDMISVYPNPSNGMFTVNLGTSSKSIVEVYNVIGEMIYYKEFNAQSALIDLNTFSPGIYSMKITANNSFSVKKVMIAK